MIKNIVSWFAVMVFAGALAACGQQNQGGEQGAAGGGQQGQQPAAPAGGEQQPPSAPAGQ